MSRTVEYKSAAKTLAEQQLRELPGRIEDIAEAVGAPKTSVHEWRCGRKKPGRKNQELIARAFKHITTEGWLRAPDEKPVPAVDAGDDVESLSNLESANRLLREIRAAAAEPEVTPTTREKLAAREISVLRFREDLLRREQLLESDIVNRHPQWVLLRERLAEAAAHCCAECSARVVEALR